MDIEDFISCLDDNDIIMFSESGDATLKLMSELCKYTKEQFNEILDEYESCFNKLI